MNLKGTLVIVASLLLSSCAQTQPVEWTNTNKAMFGFAVAGSAADVVTTQDALNRGCSEANPIYGSDPNTGSLVLGKVILMGLGWTITEHLVEPEDRQTARNWVYGTFGVINTGVSVHNVTLDCY